MLFIGTIVNAATVIGGSLAGGLASGRLPRRHTRTAFDALGLFTIFLGIRMALQMDNPMIVVVSLVAGSIMGSALNIGTAIERLTGTSRTNADDRASGTAEGILTAFLVFCIGSMTVVGAINEGLGLGSDLLLTKAAMDFFSAIIFAGLYGWRAVMTAALPLVLFQGGLTLAAHLLGCGVDARVVADLSAVGGVMMIGLGLSILEIRRIAVVDMLPALALAAAASWTVNLFN